MTTRGRLLGRSLATLVLALILAVALGGVAPTRVAALTLPAYRIDAQLDVAGRRVAVHQVTSYRNSTGLSLSSLVFRAVPAGLGLMALESCLADGVPCQPRVDGSVLEIPLPSPLPAGGATQVELRFTVSIPDTPGRVAASARGVTLGYWFPMLAVHRGDWDRRQFVDVGDASFSEVADFDVTLTTSQPLEVAATGRLVEQDGARRRYRAESVRDFALTASAGYVVRSADADGIPIRAYAMTAARADMYAERGAAFVRWFASQLGPYPYPALSIADADLPASFGGLEYPGLIMMAPGYGSTTDVGSGLDVLIAHETAHQWFYSVVGNDQIEEPWLDEAFATYVPSLYYADLHPSLFPGILSQSIGAGGGGPADGSVYDFPSDGPYFSQVYRRGARFLHILRERLGDATFRSVLREYVATHCDRVATARAFLDLAQAASPADLNPLIGQYFSYGAFHYPTTQRWTLEMPATPWQGAAYIFVGAEFPVSRVELWLGDRRLAAGTENAVNVSLDGVEPGEYVVLARVWNHEQVLFERTRRVTVADR